MGPTGCKPQILNSFQIKIDKLILQLSARFPMTELETQIISILFKMRRHLGSSKYGTPGVESPDEPHLSYDKFKHRSHEIREFMEETHKRFAPLLKPLVAELSVRLQAESIQAKTLLKVKESVDVSQPLAKGDGKIESTEADFKTAKWFEDNTSINGDSLRKAVSDGKFLPNYGKANRKKYSLSAAKLIWGPKIIKGNESE
jgi:hypothetical protein